MRIIQTLLCSVSLVTFACVAVACTASGTLETGSPWFRPTTPAAPGSASAPQQESEADETAPEAHQGALERASTTPTPPKAPTAKAKKGKKHGNAQPAADADGDAPLFQTDDSPKKQEDEEEQLPETGRRIGDKCDDRDQCNSHACNNGRCDHEFNGHTVPKGEQCDYDNQCDSNHCYDDTCQ